jgi:pyruvate/2-oxoglutarate/acetoin dehydrogenase E1 component
VAGGTYKATKGLYEKYGPLRVMDTPISEGGFTGLGIGASFLGVRPIIEIMSVNFAWLAMDQMFNSAAKVRYMSGGQLTAPCVPLRRRRGAPARRAALGAHGEGVHGHRRPARGHPVQPQAGLRPAEVGDPLR